MYCQVLSTGIVVNYTIKVSMVVGGLARYIPKIMDVVYLWIALLLIQQIMLANSMDSLFVEIKNIMLIAIYNEAPYQHIY